MGRFELDRFLNASRRLDLDGIDFEAVDAYPLAVAETRVLTYMMDIESHTIVYLRDLLATPAARDPDISAFLSMWVYEEFWHGEALGAFLRAAGGRFEPDRTYRIRRDAEGPIALRGLKTLAGKLHPDFVAVHMTWGAINELSTLTGYRRIVETTDHPILKDLLSRIIKDERRHYAFYRQQAAMRLDGNRRAQRLVRWALDRFWRPVGTGVRPQRETDFVVTSLFGDREGRSTIRQLDAGLDRLPGLAGLGLFERALAHARGRSPQRIVEEAGRAERAHLDPGRDGDPGAPRDLEPGGPLARIAHHRSPGERAGAGIEARAAG